MTNYRIGRIDPHRGIGLDSDHIDLQKEGQGIKLQFHCMNIGRMMFDLVANLQTKPWTRARLDSLEATNAVASDHLYLLTMRLSSSRTRREIARPRKGADERGGPCAYRGGDVPASRVRLTSVTCRKPSPNGAAYVRDSD